MSKIKYLFLDFDGILVKCKFETIWCAIDNYLGRDVKEFDQFLYKLWENNLISHYDWVKLCLLAYKLYNLRKDDLYTIFEKYIDINENLIHFLDKIRNKVKIGVISESLENFMDIFEEKTGFKVDYRLFYAKIIFNEEGVFSDFIIKNCENKTELFFNFVKNNRIKLENTAYIGHSENNISILEKVGYKLVLNPDFDYKKYGFKRINKIEDIIEYI